MVSVYELTLFFYLTYLISNMIDKQKFTELKAKYNIPQDNAEPYNSNFLYFILTKADLDIDLLNDVDWAWLKNNRFNQTLELLELKKGKIVKYLVNDFNILCNKYSFIFTANSSEFLAVKNHVNSFQYAKQLLKNKLISILNKLDSLGQLNQSEIAALQEYKLNEAKFNQFLDFLKLKTKYCVIHYTSVSPDDRLYKILSKLDKGIQLTDKDIRFINTHNLTPVLETYQLQQRKRQEKFVNLKAKYQATQYLDTSPNSPLYKILQNIEAGIPLRDDEIKWLNNNNLNDTVAIVDFLTLKVKYKATSNEDLSVSSHLYKVLKKLDADLILPEADINYLKKRKLTETISIAVDIIATYLINQIGLGQQLNEEQMQWLGKNQRHDVIKLGQIKHFKKLKDKYQIANFSDNAPESHLYTILKKLDQNLLLDATEIAYLKDENLFYGEIYIAYYTLEAQFYEADYKKTGNKWNIANISSSWRKAEQPKKALKSTDNIDLDKINEEKLKSAILTTRGGAFRDVEQLDQAEKCARQAITFQPSSHHPYTLMGAICYDRYQRSEGDEWFRKAIERGASPDSIDSEIKKSLARMKNKDKRDQMINDLLKKDSRRYSWARKFLSKNSR